MQAPRTASGGSDWMSSWSMTSMTSGSAPGATPGAGLLGVREAASPGGAVGALAGACSVARGGWGGGGEEGPGGNEIGACTDVAVGGDENHFVGQRPVEGRGASGAVGDAAGHRGEVDARDADDVQGVAGMEGLQAQEGRSARGGNHPAGVHQGLSAQVEAVGDD